MCHLQKEKLHHYGDLRALRWRLRGSLWSSKQAITYIKPSSCECLHIIAQGKKYITWRILDCCGTDIMFAMTLCDSSNQIPAEVQYFLSEPSFPSKATQNPGNLLAALTTWKKLHLITYARRVKQNIVTKPSFFVLFCNWTLLQEHDQELEIISQTSIEI